MWYCVPERQELCQKWDIELQFPFIQYCTDQSCNFIFSLVFLLFFPHFRLLNVFAGFADIELEFEHSILCRAESIFLKLRLLRFWWLASRKLSHLCTTNVSHTNGKTINILLLVIHQSFRKALQELQMFLIPLCLTQCHCDCRGWRSQEEFSKWLSCWVLSLFQSFVEKSRNRGWI